jgi:predicted phosphohydrolase
MRVSVFSDMHLLLLRLEDGDDAAIGRIVGGLGRRGSSEVVLLPGDIEQAMYPSSQEMRAKFGMDPWERMVATIRARFAPGVPIVLVPGNHEYMTEFFGGRAPSMAAIDAHMRAACGRHGVVFLNDGEAFVHGGVAFVGATMWTDHGNHRALHARHARNVRAALEKAARRGLRTVVVSHHPPIMHPGCDKKIRTLRAKGHSRREAAEIARMYCSTDLGDLVALADVWAYGHTHDTSTYKVGRTLLVTNALGRRRSGPNASFDPDFTFDI